MTARIPVDLHRRAVAETSRRGWAFNDLLVSALTQALDDGTLPDVVARRSNLTVYDDDGNRIGAL